MGFGKKTDHESGRTLDLDATYEGIIKPAAESLGLRPIRADEITKSGVIDVYMYEMLLRADVVVADISTGNVNAIYELGVRHALRPNTTVIIKEDVGRLYFDLNHVNTFEYRHLGEDIGAREASRATKALAALIEGALQSSSPDSPVYTFLPRLQQPKLSEEEYAELLDEAEAAHIYLSGILRDGQKAFDESDMAVAIKAYQLACEIKPGEPFFIQQLALATYKSKQPSELAALLSGLHIISALEPDSSNDPETLGITGAIYKSLWLLTSDRVQLDFAIRYYGRGFEIRRDYYNGENLATCFDMRSLMQAEAAEVIFDRMSAFKVREQLISILGKIVADGSFDERSDRKWVYATLSNCMYALGRVTEAAVYESDFFAHQPADWEIASFETSKAAVLEIAAVRDAAKNHPA